MDASVVVKHLLAEPDSALADRFLEQHPGTLAAPDLLQVEVANVLCHAKHLPSGRAREEGLERFFALGIALEPPQPEDVQQALRLALSSGLTAYDATYVAMARKHGVRLVTADAKLVAKTRSDDVVLLRDWRP